MDERQVVLFNLSHSFGFFRVLRDMTGPMTMDDIEAQFCPPPWGDFPKKHEFISLKEENRDLWEKFRNIDIKSEQALIQSLEPKKMSFNRHRDEAKEAMRSWLCVSKKLRRLMKSSNPTMILEAEMKLLDLKKRKDKVLHHFQGFFNRMDQESLVICQQSSYMALLYQSLCQFHRMRFSRLGNYQVENIGSVFDIEIEASEKEVESSQENETMEVTCSDLVMAMQEMGSKPLSAKILRNYIATQIHGTKELDNVFQQS